MIGLLVLTMAQSAEPVTTPASYEVAAHSEQAARCTVPTAVIPPFNNSPGAIQQSEAATRIVLSTREGREAFPDVDPNLPVCSTFAISEIGDVIDAEKSAEDAEVAVGGNHEETDDVVDEEI